MNILYMYVEEIKYKYQNNNEILKINNKLETVIEFINLLMFEFISIDTFSKFSSFYTVRKI